MLKFYFKVLNVMGKALSGKLSCPCDRSCYFYMAMKWRFLLSRIITNI